MTKTKIIIDDNGLKVIFDYIDQKIDDSTLALKADISHLPTKDEFYEKMDKVMGELKTIRVNQEILSPKTYHLEGGVGKLEKIHPSGHHVGQ